MRDSAKNDRVLHGMIFQKCIGLDMFSWIRHYVAEVCARPSALSVLHWVLFKLYAALQIVEFDVLSSYSSGPKLLQSPHFGGMIQNSPGSDARGGPLPLLQVPPPPFNVMHPNPPPFGRLPFESCLAGQHGALPHQHGPPMQVWWDATLQFSGYSQKIHICL